MNAFVSYLASECGVSRNTIEAYKSDLRLFSDYLNGNLNGFTASDVSAFIASETNSGHATTTIRRRIAAIRAWLKYQAVSGHDVQHLLANIETPKAAGRQLPKILSREQTAKLINSAESVRDSAILELLYATGIRASELCDLAKNNINFSSGSVRVFGKGNAERIVPMHKLAASKMVRYLATRTDMGGYAFVDASGNKLTRKMLWSIVKRAWTKSGLTQQVSPHTLRHCFATHLIQGADPIEIVDGQVRVSGQQNVGGIDVRFVQSMLGHASVSTTAIYLHTDIKSMKRVHALLGR